VAKVIALIVTIHIVVVVLAIVTMMVTMRMQRGQMHVRSNRMTVRFIHTAIRVRMRQSLPQHEKRNQQQ
jgi:hypothetical protein